MKERSFMNSDESIKERRKFKRLKKEVDVIYMLPLTFIGRKWKSKTLNISGGGVCIETEMFLEKNIIVAMQLEIRLDNGRKEVLRTLGQVVWSNRDNVKEEYLVGVKFILDDGVGKKIENFVEKER